MDGCGCSAYLIHDPGEQPAVDFLRQSVAALRRVPPVEVSSVVGRSSPVLHTATHENKCMHRMYFIAKITFIPGKYRIGQETCQSRQAHFELVVGFFL